MAVSLDEEVRCKLLPLTPTLPIAEVRWREGEERYFFIAALTGSLTFGIVSNRTFSSSPPTFSVRRI